MKRLFIRTPLLGAFYLLSPLALLGQAEESPLIEPTIITSVRLEMQGTEARNHFYFTEDVVVKGTNLLIKCEELTVVAFREGDEEATIGQIGALESIIARGSVEIQQAGRTAYAGLAEVDPREGTVTLSDNPRIIDDDVEVSGYQFVLHQGRKTFESIPDPNAPSEQPSRSVVRLGALPDLGFAQESTDLPDLTEGIGEMETPPVEEETTRPDGEPLDE
jgi:lipopolysaccharide export system protein LptA